MSTLAQGKVPHTSFEAQAGITLDTNFFGTLAVTRAMLPLLRESDWRGGASGQLNTWCISPCFIIVLRTCEIVSVGYFHRRRRAW